MAYPETPLYINLKEYKFIMYKEQTNDHNSP